MSLAYPTHQQLLTSGHCVNAVQVLSVCGGVPLDQWVAQGHDQGTTLHALPSDEELVAMGRALLGMPH